LVFSNMAIALKAPAKDVNLGPAAIRVRLPRRRNRLCLNAEVA
jgi:hypothetical protein